MEDDKSIEDELFFEYQGEIYPSYIKTGNAASFVIPFAKHFCKGKGLDIGGFFDWTFPGATPINILIEDKWDAYNIPDEEYDYIFSSHTLEHLPDYVKALEYWKDHIRPGGTLFLYLPHPDMGYWLPQNNRKHLHSFNPAEMSTLLKDLKFKNVICSERDLYWSFSIVGIV